MTTYRRFCCNDLLRFGSLNLNFENPTPSIRVYMNYLAMWPGNCLIADVPGGRIAGYIFAAVVGKDQYCTGRLATIALASVNLIDSGKKLSKLLEDCCETIYNAMSMQITIPANNYLTIDILSQMGYRLFRQNEEKLEMRKLLPRLMAMMAYEYTRKESIIPPT